MSCPNCGASLALQPAPLYCPQCGQATALGAPGWRETVRACVERWRRTGVALIAHPGRLTLEHIAGRRLRYVPPLRLYLVASFLFFLVVKVLGIATTMHIVVAPAVDAHGKPITAASDPAAHRAAMAEMQGCIDHPGSCSWAQTQVARIGLKGAQQAEHPQAVAQRMLDMAPNAVFVLLPVFAALLMLAYRSRGMRYGAHFVFSLHIHSFWFLALLLLLQIPAAARWIGAILLPGYALWALRRVYGGRRWVTLGRATLVSLFYLVALTATVVGLSIASVVLN